LERNVKVLLVNYEFPPMGGGAGNATFDIARGLAKRGHAVDVLTSRMSGAPDEERREGVRVFRVTSWRRGIHHAGLFGAASFVFFGFFKLRRLVSQNRYDLVHYFFSLPSGLLSFYSNGIKGLPYIVSLRGSDVPGYDTESLKLRILHPLFKPLTKRIWNKARRVFANSEGLRDLAVRTDPGREIEVILNGVDVMQFARERTDGEAEMDNLRILCVSRLIERKGIGYLIDAMSRIGDTGFELDIVGTGIEEEALKTRTRELALEDRIRFHGFQPKKILSRSYHQADVLVLPSLSESLSMALLEGMGCGLPVVASNVGGIPDVVRDGENGILVEPGDSKALADALIYLKRNPSLREEMGGRNARHIRKNFSWEHVVDRYEEAYGEIVKEKGGRTG
jgi:glycosyltransferase involved in cell wall biosynthesis